MSLSSQPYLSAMQSLNLYTPTNVYSLDNNKLTDTISTIADFVSNNSLGFTNSLLARVLLPNTPIQQIANQELALALAARVADDLRTNLLPSVSVSGIFNVNINEPLNYWDISGSSKLTLSNLLKVMTNYETLENPVPFITNTFTTQNSDDWLKANRGQGQKDQYTSNTSLNKYNVDSSGGQYGKEDTALSAINLYDGTSTDGLLYKTNALIADNTLSAGIPSETSKPGNSISLTATVFNHIQGDGTLRKIAKGDGTTTDDTGTTFLRVFTSGKPYQSTGDLMKFAHGTAGTNSVLQTVFPNIAPSSVDNAGTAKNLMFSIENLAFVGSGVNLKPSEKSDNGGRVMWFAPYDLQFSENISAGWDKVNFIGRSESIYTYNGSERTGNLSFQLIADYPAEMNNLAWTSQTTKKTNNAFNKYFRSNNLATATDLSTVDKNKVEIAQVQNSTPVTVAPKTIPSNNFQEANSMKYYFDNDDYTLKATLTQDNSTGTGQAGIDDFNSRIAGLIAYLNTEDGKQFKVIITATSSSLYTASYNTILSYYRGRAIYNMIIAGMTDGSSYTLDSYTEPLTSTLMPKIGQYSNAKFTINFLGETKATNKNSTDQTITADVVDRFAVLYLQYDATLDDILSPDTPVNATAPILLPQANVVAKSVTPVYSDFYFERLKPGDTTVQLSGFNTAGIQENLISTYSNNLKYFSPIFHSQTPVDLNERVTFLNQCTKQGNSLQDNASNTIFGKPPVCILRLGDFFNTKIIINNISIDYTPLIWDTNPEGIGMQPMIAKVTMSIVIIGGSSLAGPISKLQNALDYNYYANTEVYNKTASASAITSANTKPEITNTTTIIK